MIWRKILLIITLAVAAMATEKASIETSAEPTSITIGDLITYKVEIVRDTGIEIRWPGAGAELGQFQIVNFEMQDLVQLEDGREREVMTYYISTYDVGEWTIPPTAIAYYDSSEDTVVFLRTEPITITVKSLLSESDWERIRQITETDTTYAGMEKQIAAGRVLKMAKEELLRDITAPKRIKRSPRFWIGLAIVVLLLAGTVLGYLYWRKRRGISSAIFSLSAPSIPPHEKALADLALLIATNWLTNREYKRFYSRLSEIVREYIENGMGVRALELSTSETMENLSVSTYPIENQDRLLLKELLDQCDLVKFAKLVPTEDWHLRMVERAKEFVEHTKPAPPPPDNPEANEPNQPETGSPTRKEAE